MYLVQCKVICKESEVKEIKNKEEILKNKKYAILCISMETK